MERQKKKVQVPLISNYVFVQLEDKEREQVFSINGVVRYFYWLGKPALIRDEEIKALQQAMESTFLNVNVSSLVSGEETQVPHGLFKGQTGIVKNISNQKVQIILHQLGWVINFIK